MVMNIEWKIITDYPEYEVSNLGQIRRKDKVLKPKLNTKGYYGVDLWKQNQRKRKRIHRLVACAFLPNPDNKKEVDHIDRCKTNNMVTNLRWVTRSENMLNTYRRDNPLLGISWKKSHKQYEVHFTLNNKIKHYGLYKTIEEAIQVRDKILDYPMIIQLKGTSKADAATDTPVLSVKSTRKETPGTI